MRPQPLKILLRDNGEPTNPKSNLLVRNRMASHRANRKEKMSVAETSTSQIEG